MRQGQQCDKWQLFIVEFTNLTVLAVQRQRDRRGRVMELLRDAAGSLTAVALPQRTAEGTLRRMNIDLASALDLSASVAHLYGPHHPAPRVLVQEAPNGRSYCVCDFGPLEGVYVTDVSGTWRRACRQQPTAPESLGDEVFSSCAASALCATPQTLSSWTNSGDMSRLLPYTTL